MADYLPEVGIDVPFISILTPFKGTALYEKLDKEHRIISQRGLEFYNGYNVAFIPNKMTPEELLMAHRSLWNKAFSFKNSATRIFRGLFKLRLGAILLSLFMNGFYCLKKLRNNSPIDMNIR
ncbi:DUF4070 domain-containing protein [Sporomusa malonica]|uniref:DUF4070 domain-containing protein n=1 Tax=Sporomusa malonica TaxID=112901 RepID=A0A1W1ZBZ7_9FIRM|nr:DUF4070 domain-containing protein [Sporomusa malonica]SMC45741.1 protein of unknown function [Sporomusa malonica]